MTMLSGRQTQIHQRRQASIDQYGTAPLNFLNAGDIAVDTNAGGNVIDFQREDKTSKHAPFDSIIVNNKSTSDINVYLNQIHDELNVIRAGTIIPITNRPGIHSVRISKRDASVTIAAGEVQVTVERSPLTQDEAIRREQQVSTPIKILKGLVGL